MKRNHIGTARPLDIFRFDDGAVEPIGDGWPDFEQGLWLLRGGMGLDPDRESQEELSGKMSY
jgi:hypothetical protein